MFGTTRSTIGWEQFVLLLAVLAGGISLWHLSVSLPISFSKLRNQNLAGDTIVATFVRVHDPDNEVKYSFNRRNRSLTKELRAAKDLHLSADGVDRVNIVRSKTSTGKWIDEQDGVRLYRCDADGKKLAVPFTLDVEGYAALFGNCILFANNEDLSVYDLDQLTSEIDRIPIKEEGMINSVLVHSSGAIILSIHSTFNAKARLYRFEDGELRHVATWSTPSLTNSSSDFGFFDRYVVGVSEDGKRVDYRSINDGAIEKSISLPISFNVRSGHFSPFLFPNESGLMLYSEDMPSPRRLYELDNLEEIPKPEAECRHLYWDRKNRIAWYCNDTEVIRMSMTTRKELDRFKVGFDVGFVSEDKENDSVVLFARDVGLKWQIRDLRSGKLLEQEDKLALLNPYWSFGTLAVSVLLVLRAIGRLPNKQIPAVANSNET